jgi:hypothetical protein
MPLLPRLVSPEELRDALGDERVGSCSRYFLVFRSTLTTEGRPV